VRHPDSDLAHNPQCSRGNAHVPRLQSLELFLAAIGDVLTVVAAG
jgi:hypothetical protein